MRHTLYDLKNNFYCGYAFNRYFFIFVFEKARILNHSFNSLYFV